MKYDTNGIVGIILAPTRSRKLKYTGLDGMPARFIIDNANIICKPLCHIVNLSIQSGEFPCDIIKS